MEVLKATLLKALRYSQILWNDWKLLQISHLCFKTKFINVFIDTLATHASLSVFVPHISDTHPHDSPLAY